MKKFFATLAVIAIAAISAVPAFAADDVISPTAAPVTDPATPETGKDTSPTSPQTGSSDVAAYALIGLSVIGAGAASVALAKSKN